jgi:transposase
MNEQDAHAPAARKPRIVRPDRTITDPDPKSIDELVPPDHPVRSIWDLVEGLNFDPLYAQIKSVEGHPGRPAIDVMVLTAVWVYATIRNISSARLLEVLCYESDPYKWLRGGVNVNYHTLSDFRTKHSDWLGEQVSLMVAIMRSEGLINLDQVGQDGMRARASAGSGSFKKEETLDALIAEARQEWDRLQAAFETGESDHSRREKAAQERAARERLERLQRAKAELKQVQAARESRKKGDGTHARASTTDPEARRMKMPDGGFRPGFNVQFATTLDTHVIVGVDVTNSGTDAGEMDPMLEQIETEHGTLPKEFFTDGGYSTINDIEEVSSRGVIVYTPVKEAERQEKEGKDPYAPRPGESEEVAAWRQRMGTEEGKQKYKERCKCELTNAQARNHGLYRFLVRGLKKVKAVTQWHALAHNIVRMIKLRAQLATA